MTRQHQQTKVAASAYFFVNKQDRRSVSDICAGNEELKPGLVTRALETHGI